MKKVAVLGCTGSIGSTTLSVLRKYKDYFQVVLLANNSKDKELSALKKEFIDAKTYCFSKADDREYLFREETYSDVDIVVNGIDGIAGLRPSFAALGAGKILATANKESLVCAGQFLNKEMKRSGGKIYPLDSEHSAVWQCLYGRDISDVKKIVLTASGGAFRDLSKEELASAPAKKALCHPNWKMGKKVTIDCATLVNKGMEIIEAKRLFGIDDVCALQHSESIVHALIEMKDNSVLASLSVPDMVLPIQYALTYPQRMECELPSLDLVKVATLRFAEIDVGRFPAFALCSVADRCGDVGGTVLTAADEVFVHRYLRDECRFYDISDGIEKALNKFSYKGDFSDVYDVLRMDKEVREYILSENCL